MSLDLVSGTRRAPRVVAPPAPQPLAGTSVLVSTFATEGNAGGSLATTELSTRLGADLTLLVANPGPSPIGTTGSSAAPPQVVVNKLRAGPHIRPGTARALSIVKRGMHLPIDHAWVRRQDAIAATCRADLVCSMTTLMRRADVFFVHFLRCQAVAQTYGVPVTRADALLRRVDLKERQLLRLEAHNLRPENHRLLVVPSHRTAHDLTYHYDVDPDRIRVHHNGVDHHRFSPPTAAQRRRARTSLGLAPDDVLCLFVGRSPERKGLPSILQSVARVRARSPRGSRLRVALAGFPDTRAVREQVDRLAIPALVPGELDRDELAARYYAAADLLLLPATVEPFGLVALEAMACGVPAVVSDSTGVAEVIDADRTGIVVRTSHLRTDLIAVLQAAVDGRIDLAAMGSAARRDVESRLSWDARASSLGADLAALAADGPSLLSPARARGRHARATRSR